MALVAGGNAHFVTYLEFLKVNFSKYRDLSGGPSPSMCSPLFPTQSEPIGCFVSARKSPENVNEV